MPASDAAVIHADHMAAYGVLDMLDAGPVPRLNAAATASPFQFRTPTPSLQWPCRLCQVPMHMMMNSKL